jgi:hypothetical protein
MTPKLRQNKKQNKNSRSRYKGKGKYVKHPALIPKSKTEKWNQHGAVRVTRDPKSKKVLSWKKQNIDNTKENVPAKTYTTHYKHVDRTVTLKPNPDKISQFMAVWYISKGQMKKIAITGYSHIIKPDSAHNIQRMIDWSMKHAISKFKYGSPDYARYKAGSGRFIVWEKRLKEQRK